MANITNSNGGKKMETKLCKHCQTEIPKKAKVCPNCRKKQGGIVKWIIIAILIVGIIGSMGNSEDTTTSSGKTNSDTNMTTKDTQKEEIVYTLVSVDDMVSLLDENALKAEKTYQEQYLEITGCISVIDSDGNYISLRSIKDEWAIIGVQCYIKNDEQLEKVLEMKIGDTVTLKGKVTEVGEIFGYSLDIDSIN